MCTMCGGKPHSSSPCPTLTKNATPVKRWDAYQKCVEANLNQFQVGTINRINFAKKNFFSQQASPQLEMGMFYTEEKIFSMSAIWEYISKTTAN